MCLWLGMLVGPPELARAQPAPLTEARARYNEGRYSDAVAAAESPAAVAADAEVSRLVTARARLERFRQASDTEDLELARAALVAIDPGRLSARDRVEMQIGLGVALFLEGAYGAAADLFAVGFERADDLGPGSRDVLLDWWASAMDRAAQDGTLDERAAAYARLEEAMRIAAGRDPASPVAPYWIAAAARAGGNAGRAWQAAQAAWVRAPLTRGRGTTLRPDLDRLVTEAIVPERARQQASSPADIDRASADLLAEWEEFKARWSAGR